MEISNVGTIEVDFMPTGLKGDDGITPTIGENGNWFLGDVDTGKPSRGEKGEAGSIKFIVLPQLPTENIDKSAIYMIPSSEQTEENKYDEYVFTDDGWESLGSAQVKVDLSNYLKKDGLLSETGTSTDNTMSQDAITKELEKKQNTLSAGNNITIENNVISATDTTYENATIEASGLMSSEDKSKLDGLNNYSLPIASAETLGGIKIGENLSIDENGVVSASGGSSSIQTYIFSAKDGSKLSSIPSDAPSKEWVINGERRYFKLSSGNTVIMEKGDLLTFNKSSGMITILSSNSNIITYQPGYLGGQAYTSDFRGLAVAYNDMMSSTSTYRVLTTNNTSSYTPTSDYNPSTKKYVDDKLSTLSGYDATKTQVLKNVSGTLQWVDEA